MPQITFKENESSLLHANYTFQYNNLEGTLRLNNFQSFPKEWKIDIRMKITEFEFNIISELVNFAEQVVNEKNGYYLVAILEEKQIGTKIDRIYRNVGFQTYFTDQHSILDLTSFILKPQQIEGITIQLWSSLNFIDHNDPIYIQKLKQLYEVEYDADYKIRETGRWDQFRKDPEEFVKRFTSGEANDSMMFVASYNSRIVGLIYPWIDKKEAGIFFTGTHPNYVNRNIATSLKIHLAIELKKNGFTELLTNNRLKNLAILKTNDKIGFKKTHRRIFLRKNLSEN